LLLKRICADPPLTEAESPVVGPGAEIVGVVIDAGVAFFMDALVCGVLPKYALSPRAEYE
jgi:hypothetical protein